MSPPETATDGAKDLPQVFGRYLLLRRLSRGGMGEIFLAKLGEIAGFEKLVIIKKILPNLAEDQEFISRFIDEAKVAIKLGHANIAPVFEVGKVDGEYFLALEYIEGRDLRRIVTRLKQENKRLPVDLCLYFAREMASGLAYAHRKTDDTGRALSVVHCDISPPNVMVSFDGEVKIIDFGIAKSSIRIAGSNPNMGFGKFGYMAPEQLVKGGVVDRRTDIYAAGVILYELVTGERLFAFPEGADYRQMARSVATGKFASPSSRASDERIDPELEAIIMKALSTKKEDRFDTAEELRNALQGKLYKLNPHVSADTMAAVIQSMFREEITDEHRLLQSLKAIDVAPFKDELTVATSQHTVTFARAASDIMASVSLGTWRPGTKRRRAAILSGVLIAVVLGATLEFLLLRPAPVTQFIPNPANEETVPMPAMQPELTTIPKVGVNEGKVRLHVDPMRHESGKIKLANRAELTPETVQAKFRQVKGEYQTFKQQYGQVLEEKWNLIAAEITYGKADKFEKIDQLLDALRKQMNDVKNGG